MVNNSVNSFTLAVCSPESVQMVDYHQFVLTPFSGFCLKDSQFLNKQGEPKTIKVMQTTFSTSFILRSSRNREGLTPIYCRITVGGNGSEFSIKRSVAEKNWDPGKVKGNSEEARSLNSYLKI